MGRLLLLAALLAVGAVAGGLGAALVAPPPPAGAPSAGSRPPDSSGAGGTRAGSMTASAASAPAGVAGSAPDPGAADAGEIVRPHLAGPEARPQPDGARSFIAVGRQLIIPIVRGQSTRALILFELAINVPAGMTEATHAMLPRLRDAFLRELFAMSYTGAFDETYTDARVIDEMRRNLRSAARQILGDEVAEVLVLDVMRQEL